VWHDRRSLASHEAQDAASTGDGGVHAARSASAVEDLLGAACPPLDRIGVQGQIEEGSEGADHRDREGRRRAEPRSRGHLGLNDDVDILSRRRGDEHLEGARECSELPWSHLEIPRRDLEAGLTPRGRGAVSLGQGARQGRVAMNHGVLPQEDHLPMAEAL
jgi:hypothetical protein